MMRKKRSRDIFARASFLFFFFSITISLPPSRPSKGEVISRSRHGRVWPTIVVAAGFIYETSGATGCMQFRLFRQFRLN